MHARAAQHMMNDLFRTALLAISLMWQVGAATAAGRPISSEARKELASAKTEADRWQLVRSLPIQTDPATLPDDDARYLFAMRLLQPHLEWRTAKIDTSREKWRDHQRSRFSDPATPWRDAHSGETFLLPRETRERLTHEFATAVAKADPSLKLPTKISPRFHWRLRQTRPTKHPDVVRANKILESIRSTDLLPRTRHWVAEIQRNNTVITFDIPGGFEQGKDAKLLMDSRNVDSIRFKLFRIESSELLAWVFSNPSKARHFGHDFIYRDFGLQSDERMMESLERMRELREQRVLDSEQVLERPMPELPSPIFEWQADVEKLKSIRPERRSNQRSEFDDWRSEPDAGIFDDACHQLSRRLNYDYIFQPESEQPVTTWDSHKVVSVAGNHLNKPGAYLVMAEANGQQAFVPLLVDPLSLTLRRCRDGVMVVVSSHDSAQPIDHAQVFLAGRNLKERTDANGVTFCRVYGVGTTAFIAEHKGQFAVGGFGRVFEGVYFPWHRIQHEVSHRMRARQAVAELRELSAGYVYADQFLAAAWADRPTYRPGQLVQFKTLLRQVINEEREQRDDSSDVERFRAADFEVRRHLRVPKTETQVDYAVLDARGREIAKGTSRTNEFGSIAGSFHTNKEAALGPYALRIRVNGLDRVLPNVFVVDEYRRGRFVLDVADLKRQWPTECGAIEFTLSGRHSFGTPLRDVAVTVRLKDRYGEQACDEFVGKLDQRGKVDVRLVADKPIADGEYTVHCSARDLTGRTVATRHQIRIGKVPSKSALDRPPQFARAGDAITIKLGQNDIQLFDPDRVALEGRTVNGTRVFKPTKIGWHEAKLNSISKRIFIYPVDRTPPHLAGKNRLMDGWVNLAHFNDYERVHSDDRASRGAAVFALIDSPQAVVGRELELLVCVPQAGAGARVLFTYEGRTVVDYHVVTLESPGYQTVRLPIRARHTPNVYLQAHVLSRGQRDQKQAEPDQMLDELKEAADDSDPTWCRIDVLDPQPTDHHNKLTVAIETDRKQYKPGEQVSASVSVTDANGKPARAEVSLAIVDETVFELAADRSREVPLAFASASPPRRYRDKTWRSSRGDDWSTDGIKNLQRSVEKLQEMARAVASQDAAQQEVNLERVAVRSAAWQVWADQGDLPIGDAAALMPRLRRNFSETAAWFPQLHTDANGKATVKFALPDSLTTYRLTGVGVTKDTRFGVQDSERVRVQLPLSARINSPRFAVEGDRLRLSAMIHNRMKQPQSVNYTWLIEGAKHESSKPAIVKVGGQSTAAVHTWISVEKTGEVKVRLTVASGGESDSVIEKFYVQPFGRERVVHQRGVAKDGGSVSWPDGFLAQRLELSLSRGEELTESLAGLQHLIAYPYGCVEQTMSRFLPAVVVNHALKKHNIALPLDVEKKLPDVLSKGLARLSKLQHQDGGWGWWEADDTNMRMTIYVLYGLVRCQKSGVEIDSKVLNAGMSFLKQRLKSNNIERSLQSRALLVLALAGRATKDDVAAAVKRVETDVDACNVLLASDAISLEIDAAALLSRIERWSPTETQEIALQLRTLMRCGEDRDAGTSAAVKLAGRRRGVRWGDTRSTSAAIEAISEYLALMPQPKPAGGSTAEALIDDRSILTTKTAPTSARFSEQAGQNQVMFQTALGKNDLGRWTKTPPIRFRVSGSRPVFYSVSAAGVQQADALEAFGSAMRINRSFSADRHADAESVAVGQTVRVNMTIELDAAREFLLLEAPHAAGLEYADKQLRGSAAEHMSHVEFRDNRLCVFFTNLPAGRHELSYELRAELAGQMRILPTSIYCMYDEANRAESASSKLRVMERDARLP